jgi:two-component system, LytTR family, response regulator
MVKILIVEDEQHSRELLETLIERHCAGVEIIATAVDANEAVEKINYLKPELVIMDIELPYGNAFEVLKKVSSLDFEIIFVTAYNEYMRNALQSGAIDYILKPIDQRELVAAIEKAVLNIGNNKSKASLEQIFDELSKLKHNHIALPTMEGFTVVKLDEIIRIDADGSYCKIFCTGKRNYLISKQIHDLEDKLSSATFVRLHHSHIVNLNHVIQYIKGRGGQVVLSDGSVVDVSSRKKDEFISRFF